MKQQREQQANNIIKPVHDELVPDPEETVKITRKTCRKTASKDAGDHL